MKAVLYLAILVTGIFSMNSCENSTNLKSEDFDLLVGFWVSPIYSDTLISYTRAHSLKDDDYGIAIKPGNILTERQNAGWCGTPPISFANYEGTWSKNENTIDIVVDFWGGKAIHKWRIITLNENQLLIYPEKTEYQFKE